MWTPDLSARTGPKYRSLANAIGEAIAAGDLAPDTRLPTHRDLAWRLGVTVGTVSRAYALAQAEGWIAGEVGRGTYVRAKCGRPAFPRIGRPAGPARDDTARSAVDHFGLDRGVEPGPIRMNQSFSSSPHVTEILATAMQRLATPERLNDIEGYLPSNGLARHRAAGLVWLRQFGVERDEDSVLIVNGCQHGLTVAFLALAKPGDTILIESLTWPGARQLAAFLDLRIMPVAVDEHGILPDAFEAACRATSPRLLYTVPTIHNPTTTIMTEDRRRAIVRIAGEHGVHIVEDGVFGFAVEDAPPPFTSFAPELALYVTSLSKPVAPMLRTGYISAPAELVPTLAAAIRATSMMPAALNTELATALIESGDAADAAGRQRREAAARQLMAAEILGDAPRQTHPSATHFWLKLPEGWNAATFAAEALARGVVVTAGEAFAAEPGSAAGQRAVRVCLGAEGDRDRIRDGLRILSSLLTERPPTEESVI